MMVINTVQFNYNFTHTWYSMHGHPQVFARKVQKNCRVNYYFHETRRVTSRNDTWHLFKTRLYTRRGRGSSHIMDNPGSTTISDCTSQYNPCTTEVIYVRYRPTTTSHTCYTMHVKHTCFSMEREIITRTRVPLNLLAPKLYL